MTNPMPADARRDTTSVELEVMRSAASAATRSSAAVGRLRVARIVDCPPSVSLSPHTTTAATPPDASGVSAIVPVSG